ncbi:LysR substrate-binding domain-containing protein [Rhizobium wenxiniae]|uniref:LysR substrate-binding domain-containing protein n=1 Tax=Rhizobium wenxiniae TaxID=1737357 RepID=UPI003C287F2C
MFLEVPERECVMPDVAFDLRNIRYALLVAEHGSFRRAAESLNLSQSTVSRRIQLLERRVGVTLFARSRSGACPTPAGERFIREATVGASHLREAVHSTSLARLGSSGVLRIGVALSLTSGFLGDLLSAFHRQFPSIEIKLEEGSSQANAAAVLSGRQDAAFIPGEPWLPGCKVKVLWNEEIYVAVPNLHPAAAKSLIAWTDVQDEIFLVPADAAGPDIEDYLIRRFSRAGFRPKISAQRVGRDVLLNMVARGFGITLTSNSTLGAAYPGVRLQPLADKENTFYNSLVWSTSNANSALKLLLKMSLDRVGRGSLPR